MTTITINNVTIPLHWNDRFYEATCGECGEDIWTRTTNEMIDAINDHCCVTP
jgi:hypothetical protein